MIFKTLNGDLVAFNKVLISTKDHLKALEKTNATVYNKNGTFNLQGLLVNSSQSVSTFTKLSNSVKIYNENLSKSTQLQNAYVQAIGKQNTSLGNYLAGLNGAKASMSGYIKYLIGTKAATIGLQVASVALNTAISMGLSLAISALISAITKWVNKEEEARKEAIENAKIAKEESNNLSELLNKYNQLSKEVKSNQGVKEDLLNVQSDLLEALGIEASQIDTLTEKYGNMNNAINQITLDSLKDAQGDLIVAIDAYEKELINVGKGYIHWYSINNRNMLDAGKSSVVAFDILEKAGIISSGSYGEAGGSFILTNDDETVDGILKNYQHLKEAQEALNSAIDSGELTMKEIIKIPLYNAINSRIDELKEPIENYQTAISDLNKNMAQQQIIESLTQRSSIPETKKEFESFKQSMIDTAIASTKFIGSQDDIRNSIINALSAMPQFTKYFEELKEAQDSSNETALFDSFSNTAFGDRIQHITDLFNEGSLSHKEYFDSLQSEIDNFDASNFTSSVEDMNKASEQLFVDSMQQTASGLSSLINSFNNGDMSISEYLEGYLAIGDTLSTLTDSLQENSVAWAKNGKSLSNLGNTKLDEIQDSLSSAMSTIESYQDSIYSLEQIMSESVTAGSDEFSAHAAVIAEDLYNIIQTGGEMADTVAGTLGTSTAEIAQSLTENVSNQEIACQAIMANTNGAISNMSSSIGELFNIIGAAISNFKVDISFGIKSIDWKSVNVFGKKLSFPEIQFELGASGESLDMIGSALSAFGESIASNYDSQKLSIEDFYFGNTDAAKDRNYTPSSNITENYGKKLDEIRGSSKSSMEATEKDWKEHLDQCLELYQAELDAGLIGFESFLSKSNTLIEEFYHDGKISAKEYYDYVKKMLETQKGVYDKVLSAVTKRFDREIDLIQDSIDAIEKQNEALEKQKDEYDTILSVVDGVYEKEIENIRSQQNAIQDTIDALQEENDERKFALQLEQAKWELYKAQTQRTKKVFNGTEFIYDTDKDAIRDAQENLADLTLEQTVDGLEKEKDALDAVIEELEYYRDIWSEISGIREKSENEQLAIALWGEDYEQLILSNRTSDIENFKNNYISIQDQINDNQTLIDSYNEKVEYYEKLKDQWSSIADAYENAMEEQYAAMVLGASWESDVLSGRLDVLNGFKNEYIAIQNAITEAAKSSAQAQAAAQNISSTSSGGSTGSGPTGSGSNPPKTGSGEQANYRVVDADTSTVYLHSCTKAACEKYISAHNLNIVSIIGTTITVKKSGGRSGTGTRNTAMAYASGTEHAKRGLNLVGEKGTETIIDNKGNVSFVTQPTLVKMQGGEIVKNAAATKSLLENHPVVSLEKNAPTLKRPSDVMLEQWQKIVPDLSDRLLPATAALLTAHQFTETHSQSTPVVQNITLTLPNVTNNSGYERIKKELRQMQIDAYQNAHRRNP